MTLASTLGMAVGVIAVSFFLTAITIHATTVTTS